MNPPDWAVRTKADERAIEQGCYWDQNRADRIINFTQQFFRSQFIPGKLRLVEDQKMILRSLEGWRLPNGNRRFRFANIHCCKKVIGKTLLCAVLAHYELFGSGEQSPICYAAACSKENAAQIFEELRYSLNSSAFGQFATVKAHTKTIEVPDLNAVFKSVASDGRRLHGPNCSLVVLDECHEHRSPDLWNALRPAIKARGNGLVVAISTAGSDLTHFYYKIYQKSKRILSGEDTEDITHFAYVREMDQDGNPEDPEQWHKANPLLGSEWCSLEQFKRDLLAAKSTSLGEYLNFQRLYLNRWVRAEELAYFDVSKFDELKAEPTEAELKNAPAAIGVDLSEAGADPSSVTITWELQQGRYYSRSWAWVCEHAVEEREKTNARRYQEFPEMQVTKGSMLDERVILDRLIDLVKNYDVKVCNFDPRSAYVMANRLQQDTGVSCERVPPNARFFNPAMVELRKAIEEKRFSHAGSEWLKFCLQNVRVSLNRFDEVYPVRARSVDKVDCSISQLLSLLGLLAKKPVEQSQIIWN